MYEYVTEAVVLDREPHGEADIRFALFTRAFGKLVVRARSARKITSKLAGHLEPGSRSRVRIVEKKGMQIVDALKSGRSAWAPPELFAVSRLLPENEPIDAVWDMLSGGSSDWRAMLGILGWNPGEGHRCAFCGKEGVDVFYLKEPSFFCADCASRFPRGEVLYIR